MPRGVYLHKPHSFERKRKISLSLKGIREGKTLEELHGIEKATSIREKMRMAKLGKKRPFIPRKSIGENHWHWIVDRNKVKLDKDRGGPLHKQWSRSVKSRDNFKCKVADDNCFGRVVAHHILPWISHPSVRYEVNNGITLCHFHHPRKRTDEKRLKPLFLELVKSN